MKNRLSLFLQPEKNINYNNVDPYEYKKGAFLQGNGTTPLKKSSWYMVNAFAAAGTQLPIGKIGAIFKTPDSGNAITPIVGDDVYQINLEKICKIIPADT